MSNVLLLHITLKDSKPAIWRKILVEQARTFYQLHHIIQIAMGWQNYHQYNFKLGNLEIGTHDPEYAPMAIEADKTKLGELITEKGLAFEYLYDFGDNWKHEIRVESIYPKKSGEVLPTCLVGGLNCPPEDCGGLHGFYHNLSILKNPRHPEYHEIREWMGQSFDPIAFDIGKVNRQLGSLTNYIRKWEKQND